MKHDWSVDSTTRLADLMFEPKEFSATCLVDTNDPRNIKDRWISFLSHSQKGKVRIHWDTNCIYMPRRVRGHALARSWLSANIQKCHVRFYFATQIKTRTRDLCFDRKEDSSRKLSFTPLFFNPRDNGSGDEHRSINKKIFFLNLQM